VVFRQRLLTDEEERYAFERFLTVAREAGFLPPKLRVLLDSSPIKGAGAVQDTSTLLRKGIRRLLKAMGFTVPAKRRGLAINLARYRDRDRKSAIDWSDPQARAQELGVLVADADAVLTLASEQTDDPDVRATGWLLTKILGDDVMTGQDGAPELGEGVARDRIISWTDPQMRHGRKSAAGRWNGGKVQVATEAASELITAPAVAAATAGDGAALLPLVAATEAATEAVVDAVTAATASGGMDNRVACGERGIDLVAPVPTGGDPAVAKEAFTLGADGASLTCPAGQTSTDWREVKDADGRDVQQFRFARAVCEACPLFARCVRSATSGRTVTLHDHEDELRAARARQGTAEFREAYRQRAAIERKIAELMQQGLREARYVGREKQRLQARWTAAAVNLKRLLRLTAGDPNRLAAILAGRPVDRAVPIGVPG
jgi:hypothetical protein